MQPPSVLALLDFSKKVVIVTGSGRGIGAGIALRFAEAGASVVLHYHQSHDGARQVMEQIKRMGAQAVLSAGDLTQPGDVDSLIQTTLNGFGRLDVLVNNAGIYPGQFFVDLSLEEWRKVLDANLTSTFLCTQAAARQMIVQGDGGAVVNISSIEAQNPTPLHTHYCAAKAAVDQFSRTTANELGRHGIRVNVVSPGLIWTEGIEQNWPEGVKRWMERVPLDRLGMPADVADACLFLASPAARWISGANIVVDDGMLSGQVY